MKKNRLCIKDVILQSDKYSMKLLFGQFLDDFYRAGDMQYALIKDEPPYKEDTEKWLSILAATAHRLAIEYHIAIPKWVLDEKYIAKKIYYAFDTKNIEHQQFLEETSLPEFKERNLMLGDNVLSRC